MFLRPKHWRILALVCAFFLSLSYSFGAIAFFLIAVFWGQLISRFIRVSGVLTFFYSGLIIASIFLLTPLIIEYVEHGSGRDFSNLTGRVAIWQAYFQSWDGRMLFGFGYEQTVNSDIFLSRLHAVNAGHYTPPHLHNTYLQYLADSGIVGFISFLLLLATAFRRIIYAMADRLFPEAGASFTALLFLALNGLTETTFWYNSLGVVLLGYFGSRSTLFITNPETTSQTNFGTRIR